ncbi:hypothetical protein DRJ17_05270 [Candidatus Woesearchaeota archaeon]|nr:MAG: hypothetical protein DRJ17_05270 [Candidatus Woesearchaeota archaeon]
MKERIVQKNFVEKLDTIRKLVSVRFPKVDMQDFKMMSRIAHYHYNKKKFMITGETKEFYNFLIENGYNPFTVYRWLLLERIPEDIRFQLKQRQISQKKAISKAFRRRHENDSTLAISIKELGLNLIRRM